LIHIQSSLDSTGIDNQYRWNLNTWWGIINGYLNSWFEPLNEELTFLSCGINYFLEEVDLATKKCGGSKMVCHPIFIVL